MTREPTDETPIVPERDGAVVTIWLNRPHRLNAVSEELYQGLITELSGLDDSDRVVVLRGRGRAFCVGADLKAHREGRTPAQRRRYIELGQAACEAIQTCPRPVVAAVHGYALGAGAELALSCDFVIMAENAQMGFPELSLGTYVGGGLTHLLPRLVGLRQARDLVFLHDRFTGRDAADWGLVTAAVAPDDLGAAVADLAGRLTALAPLPVRFAKRHLGAPGTVAEAMAAEADALMACMETDDWAEGVAAFAEKRTPRFQGR